MGLLLLIFIISFIVYYNKTNNTIYELKKENEKLKKQLKSIQNENSEEEIIKQENIKSSIRPIIKTESQPRTIIHKKDLTKEEKIELQKKKEKAESERKNTTILLTGSILIILAAIVFLMSTWNTIPNIVKTIVMVLLIGVFLGASKIAKERFNLEKASKTFFYLAMAYIPICLLSCSIFGLFGHYLSIFGEGRFTYLTFSMVLISGIYYITYKKKNEIGMLYGSILSQISATILFGLIFGNNVFLIFTILLIYNILLIFLTKKDNKLELLKYFYKGIPYIIGIILIPCFFTSSGYILMLIPLLALNFLLLHIKKENSLLNAYLFNIALYAFGIYLFSIYDIDFNKNIKIILGIIYSLSVLLLEGLLYRKDEKIQKSSMVVSLISLGVIYLKSLFNEEALIKPYMVSILESLLMLAIYIKSKYEGKTILGYLIPITLFITLFNLLIVLDAGYHTYIIMSLIVFIIGELIKGKEFELLKKGFFVVTHIVIVLTYMYCIIEYDTNILNDVIYFVLLGLLYLYSFIKTKSNYKIFKYLTYITSGFILLTGINFLELSDNIKLLIPIVISVTISLLERKYKYLCDEYSKVFLISLNIISYVCLINLEGLQGVLLSLLLSAYLIYDNVKNDDEDYLRILPSIGFFITLLFTGIEDEYKILLSLIATICTTIISISRKKLTSDVFSSIIFLTYTLEQMYNDYIQITILLIWSISNMYFMKDRKAKDLFKLISYLGGYGFYYCLISDLDMNNYASFYALGIVIIAILILKQIVSKYVKNIDILEYLTYISIYATTLFSYADEKDGMIFVLFIVGVVIYSYMRKYGILFIVSTFTILVNAILLTREFWFAIPWWIYLLLIGGILIGFAIKNESDDKKEKINVENFMKKLKDKIEK